VVVISKTKLTDFGRKHADAVEAVNDWWDKPKKQTGDLLLTLKGHLIPLII